MLAERLARYSRALGYDDLPGAVVHEVKRRVLDSLGCALGAWNALPCRIARGIGRTVTVPDGATLWGTTHKTLPDLATFANGALVRYLDFNDTYLAREPAHPSDNIAAVLAVGEASRASGKRVIQAIALAYEVQCRLCDAAALRPRGWDHVTYGSFSSALGAAKVMKLSDAQTLHAINLAGVANIALRQTRVGDLSMWKACAFSNAARNGVFAATLAQRGMTGPAPIFEGEKGFMKLVSGPFELAPFGGEQGASEPVTFKILDTYVKHYPVEYHAQTAVEAVLALRADMLKVEGTDALAGITDVEIGSYDVAMEIIGRDPEKWRPQTRETADHSFPYCVAVALLDGKVTQRSFEAKRLADPVVHELIQKVRVVPLSEFTGRYPLAMPTRIMVRTKAGHSYVQQVDYPLGHPKNRMSDHDVEDKFRRLAAGKLERARMNKLIDFVWKLDQVKDVSALMPLLKLKGRG
ncbi:MmgE/PrpD family protein [Nitrospira sp. NS4]|uniref:MmgE/PrpD family protein n=1 Tax=Nitrospira sp. NS4 TaxID=3414498 RepID=UPI003C2FDE38